MKEFDDDMSGLQISTPYRFTEECVKPSRISSPTRTPQNGKALPKDSDGRHPNYLYQSSTEMPYSPEFKSSQGESRNPETRDEDNIGDNIPLDPVTAVENSATKWHHTHKVFWKTIRVPLFSCTDSNSPGK